jgi:hypothetical protein
MICALTALPSLADVAEVTVPGTSCIYFAGQEDLSLFVPSGDSDFDADVADAVDTMPVSVDITGFGDMISITAVGIWGHDPGLTSDPDGYNNWDATRAVYTALGISPVLNGRLNMLIGVFLTDDAPSLVDVPDSLVWGTDDMTTPELQQAFVIGSNLSGITVPVGATRLFLGLNNGYEWNNNVGELTVRVVPVPAAVLLGMLGLGAAGIRLRKYV